MKQKSTNFWEDHQIKAMSGVLFLARAKVTNWVIPTNWDIPTNRSSDHKEYFRKNHKPILGRTILSNLHGIGSLHTY